jgi:hypothetical protein
MDVGKFGFEAVHVATVLKRGNEQRHQTDCGSSPAQNWPTRETVRSESSKITPVGVMLALWIRLAAFLPYAGNVTGFTLLPSE